MSFRNSYNLVGFFDGGVLEVSSPNINGGAFTDVTFPEVGGHFLTGGYNERITNTSNSPLVNRMTWSGNSGGYINTLVDLGPNVPGHTIKLRFRMGSASGVSAVGWWVDTTCGLQQRLRASGAKRVLPKDAWRCGHVRYPVATCWRRRGRMPQRAYPSDDY